MENIKSMENYINDYRGQKRTKRTKVTKLTSASNIPAPDARLIVENFY